MENKELRKYINHRLSILKQLGVKISKEQLLHIYELKSEIAVDNCIQDILDPPYPKDYTRFRR